MSDEDLAGMVELLLAGGPADGAADAPHEALATFGRFVGTWDVEVTYHHPDGSSEVRPGEWRWSWILDGRAIQDVWRVPPASDGPATGYGTTVRLFDPSIGAWHVVWFGAVSRSAFVFRAAQAGDQIVMDAVVGTDEPTRWIFSEIGPDRFAWRNVSSGDGGASWRLQQEMVARRRLPAAGR